MPRSPEPLSPARGIIVGIVASIPLWGLLGWSLNIAMEHSARVTLADQETDLGSSFRIANGGQP